MQSHQKYYCYYNYYYYFYYYYYYYYYYFYYYYAYYYLLLLTLRLTRTLSLMLKRTLSAHQGASRAPSAPRSSARFPRIAECRRAATVDMFLTKKVRT